VTAKYSACSLGHRIRKIIASGGVELAVYQCCDSRECPFKVVKGGAMFCTYGEPAAHGREDGTRDQHHKEQQ
jgi:hypothetical protein